MERKSLKDRRDEVTLMLESTSIDKITQLLSEYPKIVFEFGWRGLEMDETVVRIKDDLNSDSIEISFKKRPTTITSIRGCLNFLIKSSFGNFGKDTFTRGEKLFMFSSRIYEKGSLLCYTFSTEEIDHRRSFQEKFSDAILAAKFKLKRCFGLNKNKKKDITIRGLLYERRDGR